PCDSKDFQSHQQTLLFLKPIFQEAVLRSTASRFKRPRQLLCGPSGPGLVLLINLRRIFWPLDPTENKEIPASMNQSL
ncbi:GSCOCG00012685001-RA-CDS, partial [Cotesia congregata]